MHYSKFTQLIMMTAALGVAIPLPEKPEDPPKSNKDRVDDERRLAAAREKKLRKQQMRLAKRK